MAFYAIIHLHALDFTPGSICSMAESQTKLLILVHYLGNVCSSPSAVWFQSLAIFNAIINTRKRLIIGWIAKKSNFSNISALRRVESNGFSCLK